MNSPWRELAVYPDPASAAALEGLLRSEQIEARVRADEPVPGLMRGYVVLVPASQWVHAQRVCAQPPLTDEEWSQYIDDFDDGEADEEETPR